MKHLKTFYKKGFQLLVLIVISFLVEPWVVFQ